MEEIQDHGKLVDRGTGLHEAKSYSDALLCFDQALRIAPLCPSALYNKANTLYVLGDHAAAIQALEVLTSTPTSTLQNACSESAAHLRSMTADAYYLLHLTTLHHTHSWAQANPFLEKHLKLRSPDLPSSFSRSQILADAAEDRVRYTPPAANPEFETSIRFLVQDDVHPELQEELQPLRTWLLQWYSLPCPIEIRFVGLQHLPTDNEEPAYLEFSQDADGQRAITVSIAVGSFAENMESGGPTCAYPTVIAAVGRGLKYSYQMTYNSPISETNASRWGDKLMEAYISGSTPPPPLQRSWPAWRRLEKHRRPQI
jgi:tetratricopeptide (TPR) repeat protein